VEKEKKTLNRDALFKLMELKKEIVELGDGEVIISEIGATAMIDLYTRKELHDADGNFIMGKFTPALVALSVIDEIGNRIFSDADILLLEKASPIYFTKIAEVARRLNGMSGGEAKN
jgi:hypothetical protein